MSLLGKEVVLRAFEPGDTPALEELINGWEGMDLFRHDAWVLSSEDVGRRFGDMRTLVVQDRASDETIGVAHLSAHDTLHRRAEAGLFLAGDWRGRGRGLEAGVLLLHYCFCLLNLERVEFRVFEHNQNLAVRLPCEISFTRENKDLDIRVMPGDAVISRQQRPFARFQETFTPFGLVGPANGYNANLVESSPRKTVHAFRELELAVKIRLIDAVTDSTGSRSIRCVP